MQTSTLVKKKHMQTSIESFNCDDDFPCPQFPCFKDVIKVVFHCVIFLHIIFLAVVYFHVQTFHSMKRKFTEIGTSLFK